MKLILGLGFVLVLVASAARAGDDGWVLDDPGATVRHDCSKQPRVVINSSRDEVVLVGACTRVTANGHAIKLTIESAAHLAVNGADNTVDIGTVGTIAVTGAQNRVTWKAAARGKKPKITVSGPGHTVAQTP